MLQIHSNPETMGAAAAAHGAAKIIAAIEKQGYANIIVATGASQFTMLSALAATPGIDWGKVTMFHLDEYVGLPESHPASFRKYIKERFIAQLPKPLKAAYFVNGSDPDPAKTCEELRENNSGVSASAEKRALCKIVCNLSERRIVLEGYPGNTALNGLAHVCSGISVGNGEYVKIVYSLYILAYFLCASLKDAL